MGTGGQARAREPLGEAHDGSRGDASVASLGGIAVGTDAVELTPTSLVVRNLTKHFGRVLANQEVSIEFRSSEVHALLGENGAGKSTLIKILSGVYLPDSGVIEVDGVAVSLGEPAHARRNGIAVVHQHSTLIPRLSLVENVSLQEGGLGRIDRRRLGDRLVDTGHRLGFRLDPHALVDSLSPGDRQRAEIARALLADARFVILDEPTAVLAPTERSEFFAILKRMAASGVGIIFVTHHLQEAIRHSDRLTVLRGGQVVGRVNQPDQVQQDELIRLMVGETGLEAVRAFGKLAKAPVTRSAAPRLIVRKASGQPHDGRSLDDVSLEVWGGEVLGVAGVEGNGQRELAGLLTGAWHPQSGELLLDGRALFDYTPEERAFLIGDAPDEHELATCDQLSIWENLALAKMAWSAAPTPWEKRRLRRRAHELMVDFDIRAPGVTALVSTLSGGNRRRVVIAREFSQNPAILVASYATKGLDVRSQAQVKEWAREIARIGAGVVYIGSDLEEILEVSDRVAVLTRGRIVAVLGNDEVDLTELGRLMLSGRDETER